MHSAFCCWYSSKDQTLDFGFYTNTNDTNSKCKISSTFFILGGGCLWYNLFSKGSNQHVDILFLCLSPCFPCWEEDDISSDNDSDKVTKTKWITSITRHIRISRFTKFSRISRYTRISISTLNTGWFFSTGPTLKFL